MSFACPGRMTTCLRVLLLVAIASVTRGQNGSTPFKGPEDQGPPLGQSAATSATTTNSEFAYPYTVSLRKRSGLTYFCAGVLIGSRHVLTAAHCVDSSRTTAESMPEVVVGSTSSSQTSGPGVQVISTRSVEFHPDYPTQRFPDLAILELDTVANQIPISLPTSSDFKPANGQSLNSLGWGQRSSRSGHSETIQVADVRHIDPRACRARLGQFIFFYQICMGGNGAGSCAGDDGGPIVQSGKDGTNDILVGIAGAMHVCGKSTRPDVHVRVAPFIDWIKLKAGIS